MSAEQTEFAPNDDVAAPYGRTKGGRPISRLHAEARRDTPHPGKPANWPRREEERPAVVRHSRGKGRGVGPHLTNLFPPKSREQTNTLMNHRASRTMAKGPGWYRSANGRRWHQVDGDGAAVCGATFLRAAGPRSGDEVHGRWCANCAGVVLDTDRK